MGQSLLLHQHRPVSMPNIVTHSEPDLEIHALSGRSVTFNFPLRYSLPFADADLGGSHKSWLDSPWPIDGKHARSSYINRDYLRSVWGVLKLLEIVRL